jgi:glycosyltransferase involved in cell wall biosynthesis
MRIAWICGINPYHFREVLKIKNEDLLQHSAMTWIHTLINEFKKFDSIELYIISSSYLVKNDVHFTDDNIKYYILKRNLPFLFLPKRIYNLMPFFLKLRYNYFRRKVLQIINQIKPDIINSHGTENEYSLPIFDLKIPFIVEIQGYINEIIIHNSNIFLRQQLKYENNVFRKGKYFIVHTNYMDKVILNQNPHARLYHCHYAVDQMAFDLSEIEKDADIAFAANLLKRKGIFDLIEACKLVKKNYPLLKVKIIGRSTKENLADVLRVINKYELKDNFSFYGYLPEHIDLLKEVKKSRITVLPTYADTSPGTIGESMALGIPSIAYKVGGTSDMIQHDITGLLVETGNIVELSTAIQDLLIDDVKRNEMGIRAKEFAYNNWSPRKVADKMMSIYYQILSIPDEGQYYE